MKQLFLVALVASLVAGCAPRWHGSRKIKLRHFVERAVVYEDSLSVQGKVAPLVSVTDYGFRVNEVNDDTGKRLDFRSYNLFWMKELRFEAEFDAPSDSASNVSVDVEFLSRSGRQRIHKVLPIERDAKRDYRTQLRWWSEEPTID
jgi:hypothetical protein